MTKFKYDIYYVWLIQIRLKCTINNDDQISSTLLPITIGVLLGNVLEPFLFLIYIYDLTNSCKSLNML